MAEWINTILQGVLLGGLYAMFAAGLSLSFGVMRMINIAHGDMIVFAGYAAIAVASALGAPPFVAALIVVPALAALGYAAQRLVFNRTFGGDPMRPLLLTFGLSIVIQNSLLAVFSADVRGLDTGGLSTATLDLGGQIGLGVLPMIAMGAALATIAAVQWLFRHTRVGRAFRATSDDPGTAQLMGIDRHHIYALAMAVASAVVALAGVFLVMRTTIGPTDGPARLLYSFESVIIGGLGSVWGTVAGGVILGVAQAVGAKLNPGWGVLFGHLAFFLVLSLRPQGLFPKTRDR
ncbi:MAG TPA: branched-chain amino acid ABC transporter permease [Burkholderiaceae bacterium]|nr:branched-chain amino acid ABC transporter permease [Burkholderiaceae bacterium]